MFGIRYEVKCPFCGETYEADHGITNYYKIKGKEHLGEYVKEHHWECGNSFLRLCADENIDENITEADRYIIDIKDEDLIHSTVICW